MGNWCVCFTLACPNAISLVRIEGVECPAWHLSCLTTWTPTTLRRQSRDRPAPYLARRTSLIVGQLQSQLPNSHLSHRASVGRSGVCAAAHTSAIYFFVCGMCLDTNAGCSEGNCVTNSDNTRDFSLLYCSQVIYFERWKIRFYGWVCEKFSMMV